MRSLRYNFFKQLLFIFISVQVVLFIFPITIYAASPTLSIGGSDQNSYITRTNPGNQIVAGSTYARDACIKWRVKATPGSRLSFHIDSVSNPDLATRGYEMPDGGVGLNGDREIVGTGDWQDIWIRSWMDTASKNAFFWTDPTGKSPQRKVTVYAHTPNVDVWSSADRASWSFIVYDLGPNQGCSEDAYAPEGEIHSNPSCTSVTGLAKDGDWGDNPNMGVDLYLTWAQNLAALRPRGAVSNIYLGHVVPDRWTNEWRFNPQTDIYNGNIRVEQRNEITRQAEWLEYNPYDMFFGPPGTTVDTTMWKVSAIADNFDVAGTRHTVGAFYPRDIATNKLWGTHAKGDMWLLHNDSNFITLPPCSRPPAPTATPTLTPIPTATPTATPIPGVSIYAKAIKAGTTTGISGITMTFAPPVTDLVTGLTGDNGIAQGTLPSGSGFNLTAGSHSNYFDANPNMLAGYTAGTNCASATSACIFTYAPKCDGEKDGTWDDKDFLLWVRRYINFDSNGSADSRCSTPTTNSLDLTDFNILRNIRKLGNIGT